MRRPWLLPLTVAARLVLAVAWETPLGVVAMGAYGLGAPREWLRRLACVALWPGERLAAIHEER